ncbi:hypothetical protein L8Q47_15005 [Enterobacter bugandensis]|uniref:hypothetical protein n=1 Tax=Enterobacter bugandensis TaxID=881260 RepID=UPI0020039BFE|nr:hypothetical protein [Enterobacter bugandensis]MCK6946312.1 hypothetical protein [Enterobacter bugandensis]
MSIEIKASHGITITLNSMSELVDLMNDEQQLELIETLSCYDSVIKHVADQISDIHGMTENGFSGSSVCSASRYAGAGTALDKARYEVAKHSSDSARRLIESQAQSIKQLQASLEHVNNELYAIKFKSN